MPRATHAHPGRALALLALLILTIVVIYDLSTANSTLASLWGELFPSQTQGERMRDNLIDQMKAPR